MRWTSALAIWFLFWAFSIFFVLPFGVRTADEAGVEKVPGQAESAPHAFSPKRVLIRMTVLGTALWALYMLNYRFGWVTPHTVDFLGAWNGV